MPTTPTSPTPPAALAAAWDGVVDELRKYDDPHSVVDDPRWVVKYLRKLLAARRACVESGWREVWLAPETVTLLQGPRYTEVAVAISFAVDRDLAASKEQP